MKKLIITAIGIIGLITLVINCSDVEFQPLASDSCVDFNDQDGGSCKVIAGGLNDFNFSTDTCKTDILFVVDNSGSMYTEQTRMAQSFPNFLASLENDSMNYQIAITTTDVINDEGRLLPYSDGSKFISNSTPNAVSLFENNIKRDETLACENGNTAACPSNDERGILAANYAVTNARSRGNKNRFFRDEAHLAVVFLSDEDVRGSGGRSDFRNGREIKGLALSTLDQAPSLVSNVSSYLGSHKTLSAHPIVVTSATCKQVQLAQLGNYGNFLNTNIEGLTYLEFLTNASLRESGQLISATKGNICASNYTAELGDIASSIEIAAQSTRLACNPRNLTVLYNQQQLSLSNYSISSQNVFKLENINTCGQLSINYQCGLD